MKHAAALAIAAALLPAWACKGPSEPVARLGVPAAEVTLPYGQRVPFELRFEALRELGGDGGSPLVFVHLLDPQGEVVRTFDHPLPSGWRAGETIVDAFALQQSLLAPALPAGEYRLTVGLYDGGDRRWALQTDGEEVARQEYAVGRVRVPEIDPAAPRFTFSPEWLPVEAGADKQTMARRWLSGDGQLDVQGMPTPAAVWITLRVPPEEPPLRIVLEEGASAPSVRVDTDCSGFAATFGGAGFHEVTVPVATTPCHIRFDANFVALGPEANRKLSVAMEQMTWQAGLPAAGSAPAPAVPAPDAAAVAVAPSAPPAGAAAATPATPAASPAPSPAGR